MLQHETQLLRERISAGKSPSVAVVEFRQVIVERESWFRGPYYRSWASWSDFLESRFYYWNLPLSFGFAQNRLLPSFRYREALDNWIFESMREVGPASHTRARNQATRAEMRDRAGMVSAFKDQSQANYQGTQGRRTWAVNAAGERWLREFLNVAALHRDRRSFCCFRRRRLTSWRRLEPTASGRNSRHTWRLFGANIPRLTSSPSSPRAMVSRTLPTTST